MLQEEKINGYTPILKPKGTNSITRVSSKKSGGSSIKFSKSD